MLRLCLITDSSCPCCAGMGFIWTGTCHGSGGSQSKRGMWRGPSASAHQSGPALLTRGLFFPTPYDPGGGLVVRRCWCPGRPWKTSVSGNRCVGPQHSKNSPKFHNHVEMMKPLPKFQIYLAAPPNLENFRPHQYLVKSQYPSLGARNQLVIERMWQLYLLARLSFPHL